jgi:predicted metal-dependent hydrolase
MPTRARSARPVRAPRTARPGTIRQGDRDKAYRPLALEVRRAAFDAGLAAYGRGDFFAAHEALEPAWMGSDDLAERALHQGLIKVAAAYVHAVRGNPAGVERNLEGARRHLELAGPAAETWRVDVAALVSDIEARLADPAIARPPAIRRIAAT